MLYLVPFLFSASVMVQGDTLPRMVLTAATRDSIVEVLFVVDEEDQRYRSQLYNLQDKKEVDSAVWKDIMVRMRESDSINLIKVRAIVDKYSWLGADEIGEQCNTAMFMVIQHADLPVQEKYLPLIREAVASGRAQPRHLALMEDRVALREGRKQRYGTQLKWDERVKAYRLAPLEDPDHVDQRRAEVGLSPLAVYLAQWGITWPTPTSDAVEADTGKLGAASRSDAQQQGSDLEANKKIAASYITEVVNHRKLGLLNEIYAPAYVFHEMDGRQRHTIADSSLIAFLNYLFKAFPDLNYTIDGMAAENDLVAMNLTATGTQKDEFLGHPASNRKITFKEMFFFRLAGRRIVEGWGVVDLNGVIQQISAK